MNFLRPPFRVLQLSPTELQVIAPPYVFFAIFGVLAVLLGISGVWRNLVTRKSTSGVAISLVWISAWILLFCAKFRNSYMLLDAARRVVSIESPTWYFSKSRISIPLDNVQGARILASATSERIALVLNDGHYVNFTGNSDRDGQEEAAQAINNFLAAHRNGPELPAKLP